VSEVIKRIIEAHEAEHGPPPEQYAYGDGIDWSSPLQEVTLYVELPYWLMLPPGRIDVQWCEASFQVYVCGPWMEVFAHEFVDSRVTQLHQGPLDGWEPPPDVASVIAENKVPIMRRRCKTVLRFTSRAHAGAFPLPEKQATPEQQTYWASLCDAHLPVVNEVIQRYRLTTYDYFAYELSPWDVPVWSLKHGGVGYRAVLVPYKSWDTKPVQLEDPETPGDSPVPVTFQWATCDEVAAWSTADATPGEFDLLDARSLMERGDYTGAVRRTVTAVEAVVGWAHLQALEADYSVEEAAERHTKTDNDFPGRLRQWRRLAKPEIAEVEFTEFETTRKIRHEIVHKGRRLGYDERGRAQRAIDTSRWLYNKIEKKPERARLRDYGVQKSLGRLALTPMFPSATTAEGIKLRPLFDS
jgi:hypothetical protein